MTGQRTGMQLTHLSLTNFRNFTRLDTDVPPGVLLLTGDNAQGKTSFLEAIYYLATFTSFHADNNRQLINFIAAREVLAVGRIVGEFERGGSSHRLEVRLIQDNSLRTSTARKEIILDGIKSKVGDAIGLFNAVLFLPQSIQIIEGTPDERRRYLNLTISQVIPKYAVALSDYVRTLSQRNALLKLLGERAGDFAQLVYWDEQLSASGSRLIAERIRAIQEIERVAARLHLELTDGAEVLRISYQPAYDPLPQPDGQIALPLDVPANRSMYACEQIQQGFLTALTQRRGEEVARGVTTIGPHRDEVRFLSNGIDLGIYGSRWPGTHRRAVAQAGGGGLDENKNRPLAGSLVG